MNPTAVCLNHRSRPELRLKAWGEFRREGLKVERMPVPEISSRTSARGWSDVRSRGCALGHRLAWRRAWRSGAKVALVFEDSVLLAAGFGQTLRALELPENWQICYLGGIHHEMPELLPGGVLRVGKVSACRAYLIKREFAQRLEREARIISRRAKHAPRASGVDLASLMDRCRTGNSAYGVWPPLVWQSEMRSGLSPKVPAKFLPCGRQKEFPEIVRTLDQQLGIEVLLYAGETKIDSPILISLLQEADKRRKRRGSGNAAGALPGPPPATLVVARYREDLDWLLQLDRGLRVVVYNKGPEISDPLILERIDQLTILPNQGREADTYLAHLEHGRTDEDGEWTIFTQADPFQHSPDFVELVNSRSEGWNAVQPLTQGWDVRHDCPPAWICDLEEAEWQNGLRVRTELMCIQNLVLFGNYDFNQFGADYTKMFQLPKGWNVAAHFLENCGMHEMAEKAWRSYVGQAVFAAIFAVRADHLDTIPRRCLPKMRQLVCGDKLHWFIYERMWLHLFGLPFMLTEEDKVKSLRSTGATGAVP